MAAKLNIGEKVCVGEQEKDVAAQNRYYMCVGCTHLTKAFNAGVNLPHGATFITWTLLVELLYLAVPFTAFSTARTFGFR